jgi:hypoxanthine phosphoribosyltransferase
MEKIVYKDKTFECFLSKEQIDKRVREIGLQIELDFNEEVILLGVLKGSFIFMADLVRAINLPLKCEFLRISSYSGMESSGQVKTLLGISEDAIQGKNVIVVEDIVDSGLSMDFLISDLSKMNPKRLAKATLLFKKEAFRFNYVLDYVGFEIPNKFVIGYGLDYDDLGRNLPHIYHLSSK